MLDCFWLLMRALVTSIRFVGLNYLTTNNIIKQVTLVKYSTRRLLPHIPLWSGVKCPACGHFLVGASRGFTGFFPAKSFKSLTNPRDTDRHANRGFPARKPILPRVSRGAKPPERRDHRSKSCPNRRNKAAHRRIHNPPTS